MKHLIVYTHLNPESFTKAVTDKIEEVLKSKGHETKIIDLYEDDFNPVLKFPDIQYNFMGKEAPDDVAHYQELITWADKLIFVFPLWWGQMPAILKGFLDRTFTHGFAYTYTDEGGIGLLSNKTAHVFINAGSPKSYLNDLGVLEGINNVFINGVFGFCDIKASITLFDEVTTVTHEKRTAYLNSIDKVLE